MAFWIFSIQLDARSIFIVDGYGNSEFPNDNVTFDILDLPVHDTDFKVEGDPMTTLSTPGAESSNLTYHHSPSLTTPVTRPGSFRRPTLR